METTTDQQGLEGGHMLRTAFRPAKKPVFPAHRDAPKASLDMIGINGDSWVAQINS